MEYEVSIDITMSASLYVEANSEEEARKIAQEQIKNDPYQIARHADAYVCHEIFDINPT